MRFIFLLVCFLMVSVPVFAQEQAPLPVRKKMNLESIEGQIQKEKTKEKRLKSDLKKAETELKETKRILVKLNDNIRKNMKNIEKIKEKEIVLLKDIAVLRDRMSGAYDSMGGITLALLRLEKTPPVFLLAQPDPPLKTARAAMLMQSILPSIREKTALLASDIAALQKAQDRLQREREELKKRQKKLMTQEKEMKILVKKRQALHRSLSRDQGVSQKRIGQLAAKARSLKDLLGKLEMERQSHKGSAQKPYIRPPKAGKRRLPVAGVLVVGYGQADSIDAKSQGITLKSRPASIVSAPMGGVVRFAGPFRQYNRLVILEHEKSYHSLIGGMEDLYIETGQTVQAGEPLGKLPAASSREAQATLYYELRHKGRTMNPARLFKELK